MIDGTTSLESRQKKEPKTLLVIAHCAYTIAGIKALCADYPHWQVNYITPNQLELKEVLLKHPVDLLIMELGNRGKGMSTLFSLPYGYQQKTILLASYSSRKLQDLARLAGVNTIVDKFTSLYLLKLALHSAVYALQENSFSPTRYLEQKKLDHVVLRALLSGVHPKRIAAAMGISTSAVSRYKMIALRKMGMKNLNEVMTGNY
ncbi:response regulator transcription factor [Serratia sp. JSRIV001]|uniref:LuxR C-terminal-related transcriptional regulator n=1 Tax=Serratia sp. JSRIV001 TaxID=2831893 RepID=UPI001CBA9256|nr:LuxR C-terminal-related transcriptional regulator [Serratia sp. JSRIV001]UAN44182.1 response regulator transcription factor [Serratia sp. JSRIV001]